MSTQLRQLGRSRDQLIRIYELLYTIVGKLSVQYERAAVIDAAADVKRAIDDLDTAIERMHV